MKIMTTVERLLVNRALLVRAAQSARGTERQVRLLDAASMIRQRVEQMTRRAA